MEELGIGRPSTYASIITTIQDREYVRKDKGRLIPEDKGRLVTAFLTNYFRKYVGYEFTADGYDPATKVGFELIEPTYVNKSATPGELLEHRERALAPAVVDRLRHVDPSTRTGVSS